MATQQTSQYLAKLIGPVLALAGLSMLLDRQGFLNIATEIVGDTGMLYVASVLGLLGGIALLLAHPIWTADWRVIITLLGWIAVFDSASWLLAPETLTQFWGPFITPTLPLLGGIAALILGAVLSYFGYFAATGRRK